MSVTLQETEHPLLADIETTDQIGITRYSRFLMDQLELRPFAGERVIDFGSGSGVMGVQAARQGAKDITFLETNPDGLALTARNARKLIPHDTTWVTGSAIDPLHAEIDGQFDSMISNPSSLPTLGAGKDEEAFYDGGQDGTAMIEAMIGLGRRALKPGGELHFLLTSLVDYQTILRRLGGEFRAIQVRAVTQFEFRPHYFEHLPHWRNLRDEKRTFFFSDGDKNVELVFYVVATQP